MFPYIGANRNRYNFIKIPNAILRCGMRDCYTYRYQIRVIYTLLPHYSQFVFIAQNYQNYRQFDSDHRFCRWNFFEIRFDLQFSRFSEWWNLAKTKRLHRQFNWLPYTHNNTLEAQISFGKFCLVKTKQQLSQNVICI